MSPDSLQLALTSKPQVHIDILERTVYDESYPATLN